MHLYQSPKILILESQMIVASDVSMQLSKLGYDVIGINTRSIDTFKAIEDNRPDIVMMNIKRNGKGSGIRIAQIISKVFQIPVVFISAHLEREVFERVINARPYAFITKPFGENDLQRGIETALNRMAVEGIWGKRNKSIQNKSIQNENI